MPRIDDPKIPRTKEKSNLRPGDVSMGALWNYFSECYCDTTWLYTTAIVQPTSRFVVHCLANYSSRSEVCGIKCDQRGGPALHVSSSLPDKKNLTSYLINLEILIRKPIRSSKNLRINPKFRSGGILGNFVIRSGQNSSF